MSKYSKSFIKVADPHNILALNVFLEAFKDIDCYYKGIGSLEERAEGKKSIEWMRKMKGNFKILALAATRYSVEEFHQLCIRKINQIKKSAYESKVLGKKNLSSPFSGERNFEMV